MIGFRILLAVLLVSVVVYTIPVAINYGVDILPIFFADISQMTWQGQFNFDFLGFLVLSAFYVAWRHEFAPAGIGLAVLAFFLGIPFLTFYLLIASLKADGDIRVLLLGRARLEQNS